MKLQIDTEKKTIKIEGTVNFDSLIKNIKKLFPENEWKEYSLESNTTITYWNNPIVYPYYQPYYYDWNVITNVCGSGNTLTTTSDPTVTYKTDVPSTLTGVTSDTVNVSNLANVYCIEFQN